MGETERSSEVKGPSSEICADLVILILLALARLVLHCLINVNYGFHRDELATLDDARHLAWGYVAYPPLTPFLARVALELFGTSLVGFRFFAVLAQSIAMVMAGLMARELGGSRWAQIVTALATAISPMALCMGTMMQYISPDFLWWVLSAYCMIRLLKSDNPRWWLGIGVAIGLGMLTKYTIVFWVAGIIASVLLTPARRYLANRWLWAGASLSFLIFLPNLFWQFRHDFVSLEFLQRIHARDIEIGRTEGFLAQQFYVSANVMVLPLWLTGLWFYFFSREGARWRPLGWMFVTPLLLMFFARGRFYYMAPAFPMLLAAGSVVWERWLSSRRRRFNLAGQRLTWLSLGVGAVLAGALMLPIAPINSKLWKVNSKIHDNFSEQIGWPELVKSVSDIYRALPESERARTAILVGNYGEAGAIDLYGPAYGLPRAISGINSYWSRGYGKEEPATVVLVGFSRSSTERFVSSCELAGRIANGFGVENEESRDHPDIFVCRGIKVPWPELWKKLRSFG
jgi:4-amino-4-deoxy-L-arabinose transferase-like glycosyltransferase